ncbi:MAG: cell envelope integrity protein TolA [Rhodocyclaceae bacterium]|jgi:colicin import membrane protein|nr:cell envelope integrity protein TolA [Rhodocyclaceae bacterium]
MNAAVFEGREDPGRKTSAVLAAVVHVALAIFLVYGIRWQTRMPEAVEVELVRAVPAPPAAVVEPPPEPVPAPKVEPKPEPKPAPKAEPKPAKPDIALREKEKPKPKPEPKVEPKPQSRPVPDKARDQLLDKELKALAAEREKQLAAQELAQMKATQASVARSKATADYIGRIRGKIKGNIVLPPDIKGNPEAIFDVVQLPSGEILSVKLKKSSGHAAYDRAVERAILKSSPLPKPEQGDLFSRNLELKFRPLEE